jgi:putative hemolysin
MSASISAVLLLAVSGWCALLRASLLRSVPERLLATLHDGDRRLRLAALLGDAERLARSASVIKLVVDLAFAGIAVHLAAGGAVPGGRPIALGLAFAAPPLLLLSEVVPRALDARLRDRLLVRTLPAFHALQAPLGLLGRGLLVLERALRRAVGAAERAEAARPIVEGLRDALEEAGIEGRLGEGEREIIENVIEFGEVDLAAIMTPRTEIASLDVAASLPELVELMARTGHSLIPVHEGTIDRVIGIASAREVLGIVRAGRLGVAALREVVEPPYLVPETKTVSQLLAELRRLGHKMAIVLDEYGGTAGLVTMGDLLVEIVGETAGDPRLAPVRPAGPGQFDVDASLRVAEVNEALHLALPEDADFETLAGFLLSRFGRFPRRGEVLRHEGAEFTVVECSERRIARVRVRKLAVEHAPLAARAT